MTDFATTSRGDRVAYDRYGPGAGGPALVFVAGAGPFRAMDPATTATARLVAEHGVTTLVFDRLGRGESVAGPSLRQAQDRLGSGDVDVDLRLDLERELEVVRTAIEAVGGRAVLCGHSSGCSISLYAAAQGLPVSGLVLWEAPVADPADETGSWVDGFLQRLDAGELEAAQEWYMKDMPPEWLAGAKASPEWPMIYANAVTLRADAESLRWATAALETGALRDEVDVDVLAVYGTQTFAEMPEAAERVRSVLPRTEVREVTGANHAWDPAAMAEVLVGFVTEHA